VRRFVALVGIAVAIAACFGAASVVPAANLAACITSDALAGKPVATIAIDCSTDALTVLASLLASQDPKVLTSAAFAEARRTKASLADAGAP
jgi:phosphoribosylcarboxyaminoimidazole (NCAIR) mutase